MGGDAWGDPDYMLIALVKPSIHFSNRQSQLLAKPTHSRRNEIIAAVSTFQAETGTRIED
jgi:hypothetical protein